MALDKYWDYILPGNLSVEKKFESLDTTAIEAMTVDEFYNFLYDEYFFWKYTAKNRLATTRMSLQKYIIENRMNELDEIKRDLFAFDLNDIKQGLLTASRIRGLGIAGASGLLAVLFPQYFATVDQFVVMALNSVEGLPERNMIIDGWKNKKSMINTSKVI